MKCRARLRMADEEGAFGKSGVVPRCVAATRSDLRKCVPCGTLRTPLSVPCGIGPHRHSETRREMHRVVFQTLPMRLPSAARDPTDRRRGKSPEHPRRPQAGRSIAPSSARSRRTLRWSENPIRRWRAASLRIHAPRAPHSHRAAARGMPAKLRAHWRTASRGAAGWRCGVSRSRLRKCGSHRIKSSFQRWASEGWGITSENAAESGGSAPDSPPQKARRDRSV